MKKDNFNQKRVIKAEGIVTNLYGPNVDRLTQKSKKSKAGNFAFIMVKHEGKMITSKNSIRVPSYISNGNRVTVWFPSKNPYKVYSNPITAFLLR